MDLRQLQNFVSIVELKSFTPAAEQLHIAQPALGLQIRKLEEEFETQLLTRHSRGVEPTEAGLALLQRARALLDDARRIKENLREFKGAPRGKLKIGMTAPTLAMNIIHGNPPVSCDPSFAFCQCRCERGHPCHHSLDASGQNQQATLIRLSDRNRAATEFLNRKPRRQCLDPVLEPFDGCYARRFEYREFGREIAWHTNLPRIEDERRPFEISVLHGKHEARIIKGGNKSRDSTSATTCRMLACAVEIA